MQSVPPALPPNPLRPEPRCPPGSWSGAPSWTAASALLLVLEGLLPLAALYLMKLIVDSLSQPDFSQTLTLVALAGLVALLTALSRTASSIVSETQAAMVSDSIQD